MDFKKLLEKLTKKDNDNGKGSSDKKVMANLAIVVLVGVLVVLVYSTFKTAPVPNIQTLNSSNDGKESKVGNTDSTEGDPSNYENEIQEKLKHTLEQIDGVGKVEVMVSFETGEEQVPAVNVNDSTSTTEEKDNEGGTRNTTQKNNGSTVVITNEGDKSEPLIVKTYKPRVSGVCIVAEGAENKVTELRISRAVVNLFNIPENKVNVYPMKK